MKINICKTDREDEFARYKRDIIELGYENAKGGSTRFLNIKEIATQLHLDLSILITEIQRIIGVKIKEGYIVSGKLDVTQVEKAIEKVINEYVLCKKCGLPELSKYKCLACGEIHPKSKHYKNTKTVAKKTDVVFVDDVKKVNKQISEESEAKKLYEKHFCLVYRTFIQYKTPLNEDLMESYFINMWNTKNMDDLIKVKAECNKFVEEFCADIIPDVTRLNPSAF